MIQTATLSDIWALHKNPKVVIGVTTNCTLNRWGELIMGKGIAEEAKIRFPHLPKRWAEAKPLDQVHFDRAVNLLRVPTKRDWRDPSPKELVKDSVRGVIRLARGSPFYLFALPPLGCGLGGLSWDFEVKPLFDAEDPPDNIKVFFRERP